MIFSHIAKHRLIHGSSFRKFSEVLTKVQSIPSTLSKKKILNEYFDSCNDGEKNSVINILNFIRDRPKTGLANKSLANILASKYFQNTEQFKGSDFQKIIDCLEDDQTKNMEQEVQLKQVEGVLQFVKASTGPGSITLKSQKLDEIISKMTVNQIRILMRILAKSLRIGLTDKSFEFKRQVESKTNQQAKNENKIIFPNIQVMLAKPLLSQEQLTKFLQGKESPNFVADIKYDGQRTVIIYKKGVGLQLFSRRKKSQTLIYPILAAQLRQQLQQLKQITSIQIDSQIVCVSDQLKPLPMQKLLSKRGKETMNQDQKQKVILYGFDVLEYNGENYINKEMAERRTKLPQTEHIKVCEHINFKYPEQFQKLQNFFMDALNRKYEGLIIKGQKDQYDIKGSRKYWAKLKNSYKNQSDTLKLGAIDLDLVLMGVFKGKGKLSNVFSAYLLGVYHQGKYYPVSKVGTGFEEAQMVQLTQQFESQVIEQKPKDYEIPQTLRVQHYIAPKYVFEVTCQNLSRSPLYKIGYVEGEGGISLRFPVFKRVRDDKQPASCKAQQLFQIIKNEQNKK